MSKNIQFFKTPINKKQALELIESFHGNSGGGGTPLGEWNAATNTPTLPSTPTAPTYKVGDYFTVSVGATRFGFDWTENDRIVIIPDGEALQYNKEIGGAIDGITGNIVDNSDPANPIVDQVQVDWAQDDNEEVDFIKNKPSIPAAQIQSDWTQGNNLLADYIKNKPVFQIPNNTLVVDKYRVDTYTADGTWDRPFKTIQAAIDYIATQSDKGSVPYGLQVSGGTYVENVSLNAKGIFDFTLFSNANCSIVPVSGNSLTADTDVADLQNFKSFNTTYGKPVVLTGTNTANNFKTTEFHNTYFSDTFAGTTLNNLAFINCRAASSISLVNTAYCLADSGYITGDLNLTFSTSLTQPSNGILNGGINLFGPVVNRIVPTVVGTTTMNVAIFSPKLGTTSGAITIPAYCSVVAYSALLRGNWTNNGTLNLKNSMTENAVAGTAPIITVARDNFSRMVVAAAEKTTPVDADALPLIDSADSNSLKKLTWANLKEKVGAFFGLSVSSNNISFQGKTAASTESVGGHISIKGGQGGSTSGAGGNVIIEGGDPDGGNNYGQATLRSGNLELVLLEGYGLVVNSDKSTKQGAKLSTELLTSTDREFQFPNESGILSTQNYVDNAVATSAAGLTGKGSVKAATTEALPAYTYNNGVDGVGARITAVANGALPTIDGITLLQDEKFTVKDETGDHAPYNGIYVVIQVGNAENPFILERATNFNSTATIVPNSIVTISQGTTLHDQKWWISGIDAVDVEVGTDDIIFTLFSLGETLAGNGLQKSGATISAKPDTAGGSNLARAINSSSNGLSVKIDGSTIKENGSNQLEVGDDSITIDKLAYPIMQLEAASFSISDYEALDGGAPATVDGEFLSFPNSGTTYAWKKIYIPEGFSGNGIKFRFNYYSAGSGDAKLFARLKAIPDNTDISSVSFGSAVGLVKTAGTAGNLNISSFSGDVTIANTPAPGKMAFLQIYRNADDAGDTLNDAMILQDVIVQLINIVEE